MDGAFSFYGFGRLPMHYRYVLIISAVAIMVGGASSTNGSMSKQAPGKKSAVLTPLPRVSSGCKAKHDNQVVQLQLGESVKLGNRWQTCQTYDGHPVIVHSSERST